MLLVYKTLNLRPSPTKHRALLAHWEWLLVYVHGGTSGISESPELCAKFYSCAHAFSRKKGAPFSSQIWIRFKLWSFQRLTVYSWDHVGAKCFQGLIAEQDQFRVLGKVWYSFLFSPKKVLLLWLPKTHLRLVACLHAHHHSQWTDHLHSP